MRVVFDTNVMISALYSKRGASYSLLRASLAGELSYAVSPLVALEYEGKIQEKITEGFLRLTVKDCNKIIDAFFAGAVIVWNPSPIRPTLPDPSDDKILECAISGDCTYIITFDKKHFSPEVIGHFGIAAITAGEFLRGWRENTL